VTTVADFRQAFADTVADLSAFEEGQPDNGTVYWSAEYLARGSLWYHFHGVGRGPEYTAECQSYDIGTRTILDVDANLMALAFLDFQDNALIGAYCGSKCRSIDLVNALIIRCASRIPELVTVTVEREHRPISGPCLTASTSFVFIGLGEVDDVRTLPPELPLAETREFVSPHWYRERISIGANDLNSADLIVPLI
jgi:hypothetical protein